MSTSDTRTETDWTHARSLGCTGFMGSMRELSGLLLLLVTGLAASAAPAATDPLRVLLVTGGHDFQTNQFLDLFRSEPGVRLVHVVHPEAQAWFKPERAGDYDVLVSYDMWQDISEEAKADLLALVRSGKGLLAMHHCLASYQAWGDYARLIGGKYHLREWTRDGQLQPGSTYRHDVQFQVRVVVPDHPVTRGVSDFTIHDETYGGFEVKPDVTPLLKTDESSSGPVIAWARKEEAGRVVYLQLGHDRLAYENPAFRQIVHQAIRWVARVD
jgi:uncharacterized protein